MMIATGARVRASQRIRNNLLWMLAAILGAAALHAVMRVIHDTTRRRMAAGLVAEAVAERVLASARRELEVAAVLALATHDAGEAAAGEREVTARALVRRHARAEACACVATLPVVGFFTAAAADSALQSDPVVARPGAPDALRADAGSADRSAALRPIVRAALAADTGSARPAVRLHTDVGAERLVAVTRIEHDAGGQAIGIVGLLAPRDTLFTRLFGRFRGDSTAANGAAAMTLAELDDESVEVRAADGQLLFGRVDASRRFRATLTDDAVLGGLAVTVALESYHIASPLIAPIASAQVWHLAAMLLGTLIATVAALRSARREAQLASARSDFVAAVSHELRMPLAQILLASETLVMHRARDERHRQGLASSILREARRLIALVENVLLFSRTGAVELRPALRSVSVAELFADARESVELAVQDAGSTLEVEAPPGLSVRGDATLLRQALVNLLDNALKYGGAGQRIRLAALAVDGTVQLLVEDEGRGVPHAERARVFEPWERLARDQSSERTGTGLGLAVVRQVAAACGGGVRLEATDRGGTRAVLELRAAPAESPTEVVA